MPRSVLDFRNIQQVSILSISKSGTYLGKHVYWKLYAIENFYRVLLHSILSVQITGKNWWSIAVDPDIQRKAKAFKGKYLKKPWHTTPGPNDIYYVYLTDLNKIALINSHLLVDIIPDIDQWIARIEQLQLPRNVIAHMNFPNNIDRKRIDVFYSDFKALFTSIQQNSKITLKIP